MKLLAALATGTAAGIALSRWRAARAGSAPAVGAPPPGPAATSPPARVAVDVSDAPEDRV